MKIENDPHEPTRHEDKIDREVRKLIEQVEERERIRGPMNVLLMMLNSDLDPFGDLS